MSSSNEQDPPSIMVVDDDMDQRELARIVAKSAGLFIHVRNGGLSAMKTLQEWNYNFDAIVIDLSMPDMDGITLTQQIRRNEALRSKANPIKIFWFTAWPYDPKNPNDPIMLGAKETGVEKIYTKGCDLEQIMYEVKEVIGRPEPSGEMPTLEG